MWRKMLVAAAAGGILLLLAAPASAKGISYAHFTGPGLPPGGITIRGEHEGGALFETAALDPKDGAKPGRMALGPAYHASYRYDFAPGGLVRQMVYPYADGGPWTYTLPGQDLRYDRRLSMGSVPPGWHQASDGLLAFLVRHGFPSHDTTIGEAKRRSVAATPVGAEQPSGSTGWTWGAVAGAVVLALAMTLVVALRMRRTR